MSRTGLIGFVLAAGLFGGLATASGSAVAGQGAHFQQVDQRHRNDDRRGNDWRGNDDRGRDWRHDDRRDRYDNRRDRRWEAPRHHAQPRYWTPPRNYYNYRQHNRWPYWRQSYGRGYRYWDNGHHYYVEPGRPAVELTFVLPLR